MRSKATVVMALGLMLAAPRAFAQHSDLLPRQELRNNLRRLRDDLRDTYSSREFGARIRAQALMSARAARVNALATARVQREMARSMAREHIRDRIRVRATPRIHVLARHRDI